VADHGYKARIDIHEACQPNNPLLTLSLRVYYRYYKLFLGSDPFYHNHCGWLSGSTTTEVNFTKYKEPELRLDAEAVPSGNFLAEHEEKIHYFANDRNSKLAWDMNYIAYFETRTHVVEILPNSVSNAYKDFLHRMHVSYLIAGGGGLGFSVVTSKIQKIYGKDGLMLNGGGGLNWSFLKAGTVDELSISF